MNSILGTQMQIGNFQTNTLHYTKRFSRETEFKYHEQVRKQLATHIEMDVRQIP